MATCCAFGCTAEATAAWDVKPSWGPKSQPASHYELCAAHTSAFFPRGEGFVEKTLAERIKARLEPA